MVGATLEALPIEMVQSIVDLLNNHDMLSLRLTSSWMKCKIPQGRFEDMLKCDKHVEMTLPSLHKFANVTNSRLPAAMLRHCTIIGHVRVNMKRKDDDAVQLRALLADAFSNIELYNPCGGLMSLSLSLTVSPKSVTPDRSDRSTFRNWRVVWNAAERTFQIVMHALKTSELRVINSLDIFNEVTGCSMSYRPFMSYSSGKWCTYHFQTLKSLRLSLSMPLTAAEMRRDMTDREATLLQVRRHNPTRVLQDILHLLSKTPLLENLDLHWYTCERVLPEFPNIDVPHQDLTTGTFGMNLKHCGLSGLVTTEDDLLNFLVALRPASVALLYVTLTTGSYRSIFDYLAHPGSPIKTCFLDDLREWFIGIVHFPSPKKFAIPGLGPSTLVWKEVWQKTAINYRLMNDLEMGRGYRILWLTNIVREYGPLADIYDFVELNTGNSMTAPWNLLWY